MIELRDLEGLTVEADSQSLREIFDNLISNAVKYSPPGKRVLISARALQTEEALSRVCVSIRDEGPGFSLEDKRKLYGRFTKLSARPTGGESSTGLGLSIVKKLCELNGIAIELESTPGKGAVFHLGIPGAAVTYA